MSQMKQVNKSVEFEDVKAVVVQTLGLEDRAATLQPSTYLLGNVPEFDSMAVVELLCALEKRFQISIDGEEVTAEIFETLGDLSAFIEGKLRLRSA